MIVLFVGSGCLPVGQKQCNENTEVAFGGQSATKWNFSEAKHALSPGEHCVHTGSQDRFADVTRRLLISRFERGYDGPPAPEVFRWNIQ
jgi:hypothetical protein